MNIFSLFSTVALAAELIISPLADSLGDFPQPPKPSVSFGQISAASVPPTPAVLGASTELPLSPTPEEFRHRTRQTSYRIAIIGDSMVDTLGPEIGGLKNRLNSIYPKTHFTLLNYGVGATNIDYGLARLTQNYEYLGKSYQSLVSERPDIVVIESFAYNPYSFSVGAIDKHWLQLAAMVDSVRRHLPAAGLVIAATIAPDAATFGDGAPGINFDPNQKQEKVNLIKQYLDSTVKFAQSQKLALADAYHPSLDKNGNGKDMYINSGDHIHYSDAGRTLMAQKITEAIVNNRLLE